VIRLAQGLIVRIPTNTEQIIMCSHRYAFGGGLRRTMRAGNAPAPYHTNALRPKRFRLGYCFRSPVFATDDRLAARTESGDAGGRLRLRAADGLHLRAL
jgi:hypothetical protein